MEWAYTVMRNMFCNPNIDEGSASKNRGPLYQPTNQSGEQRNEVLIYLCIVFLQHPTENTKKRKHMATQKPAEFNSFNLDAIVLKSSPYCMWMNSTDHFDSLQPPTTDPPSHCVWHDVIVFQSLSFLKGPKPVLQPHRWNQRNSNWVIACVIVFESLTSAALDN